MKDSIFTKIINGDVPTNKIYEDERTIAILDINPIQYGHTLVIPKSQVDCLEDLEDEDYEAVMATVRRLSIHLKEELQVERVCLKVEGFDIAHAHIHLIPCDIAADFYAHPEEADPAELAELEERLVY